MNFARLKADVILRKIEINAHKKLMKAEILMYKSVLKEIKKSVKVISMSDETKSIIENEISYYKHRIKILNNMLLLDSEDRRTQSRKERIKENKLKKSQELLDKVK